MKAKGFTLIEIMVTMGIISILLAIIVPNFSSFWENENITRTKERMRIIKKALVGDKDLLQNGIRTSYGFVGDNGELPTFKNSSSSAAELTSLVNRPPDGYYPNWKGPYLSGFTSDWHKDVWGNPFRFKYLPDSPDSHGRYVSAELRSSGPDFKFDTDDDIVDDIQISESEVTPTNRVQGNLNDIYGNYSGIKITFKFSDPIDESGISTKFICKSLNAVQGYTNYTTQLLDDGGNALKLPIGGIEITTMLHGRQDCSDAPLKTNSLQYFLNDNADKIIMPELR